MEKITLQAVEAAMLDAGIDGLPAGASGQFAAYMELLLRWNAKLNLTSIRSPVEILRRHFVECAFASVHLPEDSGAILDFGSGAGFPGIPIAICCPGIRVTLAESHSRKAAFLSEVVRVLGLSCEVYRNRVESMPASRSFRGVIMRAIDSMGEAILIAAPRATGWLGLMVSIADAPVYSGLAPEFSWREPILLPNAAHTALVLGERILPPSR